MKRKWIVGLALALIATACTDRGEPEPPRRELVAEVASYDLAVVIPGRFLVGLGTSGPEGQLFVSGGSVPLSLFYLGEDEATGREPYSGCDRLVPADTRLLGALPVCADPGAGFERTRCLFVREPGVPPAGDLGGRGDDGHRRRGPDGDLRVPSSSRACGACCRRPSAENLTLASKDAPHEAIDSRAATGEIPDPELHRTTVADSVAAGHPALVVISTPVYCVSRFCGPLTDMAQDLAADYGDRAEFIHIEVWRDFENQVVNKGAADWILREDELQEPWVFLVGSNGRVVGRWDNVATRQEIEPYLRELPLMDA